MGVVECGTLLFSKVKTGFKNNRFKALGLIELKVDFDDFRLGRGPRKGRAGSMYLFVITLHILAKPEAINQR
jgi:hypothetical protein